MDVPAALKASFWKATVDEGPQASDGDFLNVSMHTGGGRAWRNNHATQTGRIVMLPFEGAYWYFEQPVSFVQFHLPFALLGTVCEGMFDRALGHADLRMPANVEDARLHHVLNAIQGRIAATEPTNLLLDSWALILSDLLLRRLSRQSERRARTSFGRIPAHGIARVIDYIEAGIDQDLRLTSLAGVAAMSVYHFARCFKDTVGLSPHAYVLQRRVMRARTMLSQSESSLAEVALSCGFSSQAHLTAAFHHRLGVTPGSYRRNFRT